jgi:hypothetical protein
MSFGDGVHHVAVLVAIGVDDDGFREVWAFARAAGWTRRAAFLAPAFQSARPTEP